MRKASPRTIATALALVPLASTCTMPGKLTASVEKHFSAADEARLVEFLIDGRGGPEGR